MSVFCISSLLNDAIVRKSKYKASNNRMAERNKLERKWKEAVVDHFKVRCRNLPARTKNSYKHFIQGNRCPDRDSIQAPRPTLRTGSSCLL